MLLEQIFNTRTSAHSKSTYDQIFLSSKIHDDIIYMYICYIICMYVYVIYSDR